MRIHNIRGVGVRRVQISKHRQMSHHNHHVGSGFKYHVHKIDNGDSNLDKLKHELQKLNISSGRGQKSKFISF